MWGRYAKLLSKEFVKYMKDQLPRKVKYRKKTDNSDYMPRCYYAVLLYQAIKDRCLDHYTGDQGCKHKINWSKAQMGGKHPDAPAIDHINPDCKAPFDGYGNPNLAFCRNDVNDAKNDLTEDEFLELCEAVYNYKKSKSKSSPSGL